jgi:hypothetical protein
MKFPLISSLVVGLTIQVNAQQSVSQIPAVLSGFSINSSQLTISKNGQQLKDLEKKDMYTLSQMLGDAKGTETGILLDFKKTGFNGSVAYGPFNIEAEFPTVAFLAKPIKLVDGKVLLEMKKTFKGVNDFFRLSEKGGGILGYRVIDADGRIIYEGRIAFTGKGPYTVVPTITEGPLINNLVDTGSVISYETQVSVKTSITLNNQTFEDKEETTHHEIAVTGLQPGTDYKYSIHYGDRADTHHFKTAAKTGGRKPFDFAFAGANRATSGGGERDFGGTNYQASRAIMATAIMRGAVFMQATGDMTNGGNPTEDGHLMEYANWKRALEPFWSKIPVYAGFGDHEVNYTTFAQDTVTKKFPKIDRFPYATESGEATFARAFIHPTNGPESEDGASYDPSSSQLDFPTYKENVYFYTYDNIAMIVLNTEYWKAHDPNVSGCPEGYIMDQQLKWLNETVQRFEKDPAIDHIFVNVHSAVFPNGDHASGAMWYNGNNTERAIIAGTKVNKGIIERRDEILDICVNRSKKFLAFLSADEHNFAFLEINKDFPLYTKDYTGSKLKLARNFYHINNGCGGSAPYAMLPTPWSSNYRFFTEPPAVALIHVNGKAVELKAFNCETFGKICENVKLR